MTGEVTAALCTGLAVAIALRLLVPPTPRLAARVRPYTVHSRTALGGPADVLAVAHPADALSGGSLAQLLHPLITRAADRLSRLVDGSGDDVLALRLHQAGWYPHTSPTERVQAYRLRQLARTATGFGLGVAAAAGAGSGAGTMLGLGLLAATSAAARGRAAVDHAVAARRLQAGIELYTINQVLALQVRVGGGVVQALQRVADRGSGVIAGELAEVLRAHAGGRRLAEALEAAARASVEPHAARTYRLLATGAEFGADLSDGLRALSADLRDERLEALKRSATKRRAAMLVPIIAVLAPVMLLFVGAPLPSIVFGGLGR